MKNLIFIMLVITFSSTIKAQDSTTISEVKKLKEKIDKIENKTINLGVSIGYKYIWNKDLNYYQEATISPIDTTLKIQNLDNGFVVLSTELIINPFAKSTFLNDFKNGIKIWKLKIIGPKIVELAQKILHRLTLIASVNLAEFQTAQSNFSFNKAIDGGLGIGLRLSETFWIAWTYEITSHRQLRDYIHSYKDEKIVVSGNTLTKLDENDNNLFYTKRLSSANFKFIFKF